MGCFGFEAQIPTRSLRPCVPREREIFSCCQSRPAWEPRLNTHGGACPWACGFLNFPPRATRPRRACLVFLWAFVCVRSPGSWFWFCFTTTKGRGVLGARKEVGLESKSAGDRAGHLQSLMVQMMYHSQTLETHHASTMSHL